MSTYDSPGFRRLTRDRKKYDELVKDTLRRQEEARQSVLGGVVKKKERPKVRRDDEYPKPRGEKK